MPDPAAFTDEENWRGGFYELALEFAGRDDRLLQAALSAVWRSARVEGCYGTRDREPADQEEVPCTVSSLAAHGHLQGTVVLPNGRRIVCGCLAVREEEGGADWLVLYLPVGALSRVEDIGGFPLGGDGGPGSLGWRRALDDWLAAIGSEVFAEAPFRLGLVGFGTSGDVDADLLDGRAPDARWEGYLLPEEGRLGFHPANR
ncbi:hypothetical protein [Streptomyces sp. NPDC097619]|uniref:hypothetical protein n=1 Tax=Streptomyces sp. NPDC097619 TaxID=3157228 RepID=UPI0033183656